MFEQKCFCAQYRGEELVHSTSGGVFFAFAKCVIQNGGCVCGAAYDEHLILKHCIVDSLENLRKIQGSKYVESDFVGILPELKNELKSGRIVLFSGTPCQVAAIRTHFKDSFQNLILMDILCHGTPSRTLFEKYISWREKQWNVKILNFEFRNKKTSPWGKEQKALITTNKGERVIPSVCDPYFSAFQKGLIAQKKCYSCKYASPERVGDITAADFWGCTKIFPKFPYARGASCLLINTERGDAFFNNVKTEFLLEEASFEDARKYNPHFNAPLTYNPLQEKIYSAIKDPAVEFSSVLKYLKIKSPLEYIVQSFFKRFKCAVKKVKNRIMSHN